MANISTFSGNLWLDDSCNLPVQEHFFNEVISIISGDYGFIYFIDKNTLTPNCYAVEGEGRWTALNTLENISTFVEDGLDKTYDTDVTIDIHFSIDDNEPGLCVLYHAEGVVNVTYDHTTNKVTSSLSISDEHDYEYNAENLEDITADSWFDTFTEYGVTNLIEASQRADLAPDCPNTKALIAKYSPDELLMYFKENGIYATYVWDDILYFDADVVYI